MQTRFRSALTYANVVSTLCLFLILGGAAVAGQQFVGSGDIKPGAIRSLHVENGSLRIRDLSTGLQASLQPLQPQPIQEGSYRGRTASGSSVSFLISGNGEDQRVGGGLVDEIDLRCGEAPVITGAFLVSCNNPSGPGSMTGRGRGVDEVVGNVTETIRGEDNKTYKVSGPYSAQLQQP